MLLKNLVDSDFIMRYLPYNDSVKITEVVET